MVAMLFLMPQDRLFAAGAVATKSKVSLGSAAWAGDKTILFLDDDAILYRSGTRRVLQQPRRHTDNPVIAETKAWEARTPESSRMDVPLFPASKISDGSSSWDPRPFTV